MNKTGLSQDKICQAAIALVNAHGLETLSMRRLAQALEVKAASLYNHVQNKSQLYDLIQEYCYRRMKPLKKRQHWQSHLIELAKQTRAGLLKNPNLIHLFATRPVITAKALQQAEHSLSMLLQAGFKHSEVLMIFKNFNAFILGHVLDEVSGIQARQTPAIDLQDYPILKQAASYQGSLDPERRFRSGIKNIIRGLESQLDHQS